MFYEYTFLLSCFSTRSLTTLEAVFSAIFVGVVFIQWIIWLSEQNSINTKHKKETQPNRFGKYTIRSGNIYRRITKSIRSNTYNNI